jgi:DNA-binding CsgD family transcriptional regulator
MAGTPSPGHDFVAQQAVLDSALRLLTHRTQALERVAAEGPSPEASIVVAGGDLARWTVSASRSWSTLLSTRPSATVMDLARSLPNNRAMVDRGLKMRSVFDWGGTEPPLWDLLAAEPNAESIYFASFAPVLMRVIDYEVVLLSGPPATRSILRLSSPAAVESALLYWNEVFAHAQPCRSGNAVTHRTLLSTRQALILELLRRGDTDPQISSILTVSLRTVQSEVAKLMRVYDASSRFALGYAYAEQQLNRQR